MILTPEQLSQARSLGFNLSQTTLGPGKSIIVGLVKIPDLATLQVQWLCLHVTSLVGNLKSSNLITSSKVSGSPAAVTASAPFFSSTDVGSIITWSSGQQSLVTGYTSPTQVTVTNSSGITNPATGVITSENFSLQPAEPTLVNSSMDAAVCGIVTNLVDRFDMPGGIPESAIMTSQVGLVSASPFVPRLYRGSDTLSVTVTNNTTNFEIDVVVTSSVRYTGGL